MKRFECAKCRGDVQFVDVAYDIGQSKPYRVRVRCHGLEAEESFYYGEIVGIGTIEFFDETKIISAPVSSMKIQVKDKRAPAVEYTSLTVPIKLAPKIKKLDDSADPDGRAVIGGLGIRRKIDDETVLYIFY